MIKKALEFLMDAGSLKEKVVEIDGVKYSNHPLKRIKTIPNCSPLMVESLDSLVDYIQSNFDGDAFCGRLIHITNYKEVRLISHILDDSSREEYMIANSFSPDFNFGVYYDVESFIIKLQSCFVKNEDTAKILSLVGNLKEENVRNTGDDGISQSVTVKTGIARIEDAPVPNPVLLAPFRTFIEIEQPESEFVFRMRKDREGVECALFQADGGAWKLRAMEKIKDYLAKNLPFEAYGISIIG